MEGIVESVVLGTDNWLVFRLPYGTNNGLVFGFNYRVLDCKALGSSDGTELGIIENIIRHYT